MQVSGYLGLGLDVSNSAKVFQCVHVSYKSNNQRYPISLALPVFLRVGVGEGCCLLEGEGDELGVLLLLGLRGGTAIATCGLETFFGDGLGFGRVPLVGV